MIQRATYMILVVLASSVPEAPYASHLTSASLIVADRGDAAGAGRAAMPRVETLRLSENLDSHGRLGGIAVDDDGHIYVSNFHDALWKIAPDGTVETLTRSLRGSSGVAIDMNGDVLQASFADHTISKISRTGEVETLVDQGLAAPVGLAVSAAGEVFVCNCGNDTISKVATDGTVSTFASGELFACPNGITFDDHGNLYVVNFNNDHVVRVEPSGKISILATLPGRESAAPRRAEGKTQGGAEQQRRSEVEARTRSPAEEQQDSGGEAVEPIGNAHIAFARGSLFVTRIRTNRIYRVSLDGDTSLFAGTGELGFEDGPASQATLARPNGIATDPDGATLWFNNLAGEWRGQDETSIVVRSLRLGDDVDVESPMAVRRTGNGHEVLRARATAAGPAIESISIPVADMVFDALAAGPEDGEPVILLHGFPETSYAFRHQLAALAEAGYRTVAPDQRGYSPEARPSAVAEYAMGNLVGDVAGFADALGFETFHLVGHDWGGAVAWVFAASFPARVRTLTVLSTPHVRAFGRALADPDDDQAERSAYFEVFSAADAEERFLANDAAFLRSILGGLDQEAVEVYVSALGTPEAIGAALNWYRASGVGRGSTSAAVLTITVPTLYLWGTEDSAFGRGAAEATAEFVAGPYRFEILEGHGHWLMERATVRVNELLLAHLARDSR
jgi:pimeloyl-ACP methyl ester carboxylesterase/DNA-binding beta-propeller fold protein YncE